MRWMLWVLLLFSAAVGVALLMRFNHGNVAILWPPYRLDLSVNLVVLILGVGFLIAHLLLIGFGKALDLPDRVRQYRARRSRESASSAMRDSLLALFEGRFGRAERLAEVAREDPALAGSAALIAARATHRMREFARRDRWLEAAEGEPLVTHAQLVTTAELAVDEQNPQEAIAAINRLHARGARHIHSLRLALRAYELQEDWHQVLQVVRQLEKRDALHEAAVRGLKIRAARALFVRHAQDAPALRQFYNNLPMEEREQPEIIEQAAAAFAKAGDEELSWRLIETALGNGLSARMLRLFESLKTIPPRERIMRAEHWREKYGDNPDLMLTLGRLCVAESLWGKAEEFLSIATREGAPAAHLALGQLYERIGRPEAAAEQFRSAALKGLDSAGA